MKDLLKSRYDAKFTKDWREHSGAWWHVSSLTTSKKYMNSSHKENSMKIFNKPTVPTLDALKPSQLVSGELSREDWRKRMLEGYREYCLGTRFSTAVSARFGGSLKRKCWMPVSPTLGIPSMRNG